MLNGRKTIAARTNGEFMLEKLLRTCENCGKLFKQKKIIIHVDHTNAIIVIPGVPKNCR